MHVSVNGENYVIQVMQVEHSNMLSQGWHVNTRAQPEWWHFNRGKTYLNVPWASVLRLFCHTTNYKQVQNPDEYFHVYVLPKIPYV